MPAPRCGTMALRAFGAEVSFRQAMESNHVLPTTFVDSVKCAVRGFAAPRGASEGSLRDRGGSCARGGGSRKPETVVECVEAGNRRFLPVRSKRHVSILWRCLVACVLGACGTAVWAQGYPLLALPAPDFALHAFAGDNVRLSEHRGEVVVLTFWSSRCNVCAAQLDRLNSSFVTYRSAGLSVFGISVDDDQGRAREFADAHRVGFSMLADPSKDVARLYKVDNLPMAILIDRSGNVRHVYRDLETKNEALYVRELRGLLNE
jgi:peroxiredoxin